MDELKSDVDLGVLMLKNLSDYEKESLKAEINTFKLGLEPVNKLIKYLEPYTEKYKDISELILGGYDIQRVKVNDLDKLLNNNDHIRNVISTLHDSKIQHDDQTLNLISNITINDHVDKFVEYLKSFNSK